MNVPSLLNLALIMTILMSSCSEEESSVSEILRPSDDYRKMYQGTYTGKMECVLELGQDSEHHSIGVDTLEVMVHSSSLDSIWIGNWLVPIAENGHFSGYYAVPGYSEFRADFRHDTLEIRTQSLVGGNESTCRWFTIRSK